MICPRCGYRTEFDEVSERVGMPNNYMVKLECQRCLHVWEQKVEDLPEERRRK